MITLYQFTISQFCEKARWALDHKGLIYKTANLLPGPHERKALKVASTSELPILRHGMKYIQGSSDIISFLDDQYQTRILTPETDELRQQAMDFERQFDHSLGLHLRRFYYTYMLQDPKQLRRLITSYGPWYGNNIYSMMLPLIKKRLVQDMKLNALEAERSRLIVNNALQKLDQALEGKQYLVGDQFSRADLTAAAFLSPVCQPTQHPYYAPSLKLPADLAEFHERLSERPFFQWARSIYQRHRWEVKSSNSYTP